MPCWTVNTVEVAVEKMSPELLMAALESLGLRPRRYENNVIEFGNYEAYRISDGTLKVNKTRDVKEIKRAYSAEVVKATAKKYGWAIKQTSAYEYEVIKR